MQCDYEYIARMDSDDVARKERFEIQINYLEEHPNIDILGSYLQEYDEQLEKEIAIRKVPLSRDEIYRNLGKQCPFNHGTVVFRKSAVIEADNYQEEEIEDYKLWIRMCQKGYEMENLSKVMVNYRTSRKMYQRRSGFKYWYKIKVVEDMLLKYKFINLYQYIKNLIIRGVLAITPIIIKQNVYPKIVRKCI